MTVTQPTADLARSEPATGASAFGIISTTDPLGLGLLFLGAMVAFLVGAIAEKSIPDVFVLLVGGGLWMGLFSALVPAHINAPRLAFPRLHAFGFWLYAAGGCAALPSKNLEATVIGVGLITIGLTLAAANILVTIVAYKDPALRFKHLDPFCYGAFVVSTVLVLALPVFAAGSLLAYLQIHYGRLTASISLLSGQLSGRPEMYALLLPGLAIGTAVVFASTKTPRRLWPLAQTLLVVMGGLSLAPWAFTSHASGLRHWFQPGVVLTPIILLLLVWLVASIHRNVGSGLPLLVVVGGTVITMLFVAINAANDSTTGKIGQGSGSIVAISAIVAIAALHMWAPQLLRIHLMPIVTGLSALLLLSGLTFWTGHLTAGIGPYVFGTGLHVSTNESARHTGAILSLVGAGLMVLNVLYGSMMRPARAQEVDA